MRKEAHKRKKDLLVVDSGDTHDGNGLSDATSIDGAVTQPVLTDIDYDVLCIGKFCNHELYVNDVAQDVYKNFAPKWKGRYLTSNVFIKDVTANKTVPIGSQYTYFKGKFGTKVLAFGFLFNFQGNGNATIVQPVEVAVNQTWFQQALTHYDVDIFVVAGHTPLRTQEFQTVFNAIRALHPAKPIAFLGGHSHIRDFHIYDGRAAGLESGRFMETIGWLSVEGLRHERHLPESATIGKNLTWTRRYLDTNRPTYEFHTKTRGNDRAFDTIKGKKISKLITSERKALNLSYVFGCVPHDYYLSRVAYNNEYSLLNLVKFISAEIIPKAVHDPTRPYPSHVIINSGCQRFDLYKGEFRELYLQ
ncbi:Metallo-dependent phosphatase-like protein, partial [Jimgerdemannia flammicorona]